MIQRRGKHRLFRLCWLLGALAMAASPFVDSSSAQDSAKPIDPKTITSHAVGEHGAVSTGSPEAVAAGLEVLQRGGNAADGAAATILALSVTDSHLFCFGGEAPIMAYNAKHKHIEVLAAQGVAPRLATREAFPDGIPGQGLKPAAVPGVFDGVLVLLERHGTMRLADVAAGTLRLLDRHQEPWHPLLGKTLRRIIEAEATAGDDRILGLRRAADYFYRGPIAREISAWCEKEGGYLRYEDFATHVTRIEEPLSVDYRGHRVYKCGVWTQGPYLLQTLKLLEGFDLAKLGHNRPETIHLSVEAMKLAMADRDIYFGDPLFVNVPINDIQQLRGDPAIAHRPRKSIARLSPRRPRPPKAAARQATAHRQQGQAERYDHVRRRRSVRQRRRSNSQRMERRSSRRHRHLARNALAKLQHLGGSTELHRPRQAAADHTHANAGL